VSALAALPRSRDDCAAGVAAMAALEGLSITGICVGLAVHWAASYGHHAAREWKQKIFDRFPGLSGLPSNHDVVHAVRLAQLQGMQHLLRSARKSGSLVDSAYLVRAEDFVQAEFRALRNLEDADPSLQNSVEAGFGAMSEAFSAPDRARGELEGVLGEIAEDAMRDEITAKIGPMPEDFSRCFRGREPGVLGWFYAYSRCLGEQVKVNDRFRNILQTTLATETAAGTRRIEEKLDDLRKALGLPDLHGEARRAPSPRTTQGHDTASETAKPIADAEGGDTRERAPARAKPGAGTLERTFLAEPEGTGAIALSPDGKRIASGAAGAARRKAGEKPARVRIWEADTGRLLAEKADLFASPQTMVFSPDGKLLVVSMEVLDGHSAERIAVAGDMNAFSADGNELITTQATQLYIYETKGWKLLRAIESHVAGAKAFALSQNGRWIAIADWDKARGNTIPCTIRIVDATNGQLLRVLPPGQDLAHDGAIAALAFSNDTVFSFGADRDIVAWNAETAEVTASFVPTLARWKRIAYAVGVAAGALLAARATGESEGFFGSFLSDVFMVAAVGVAIASMIYVMFTASHLKFGGHRQGVVHRRNWSDPSAMALAPDGRSIATGHTNGTIEVWDARSGRTITAFRGRHRKAVLSLAFSSDGSRLVSGSRDGTINVWRA
jgi:WD40 repeat protein